MSQAKILAPAYTPEQNKEAEKLELTAFFAAITLFCSTLEYLIPKPLPFIRLGLANLPLMLSFPFLSWSNYLWLLVLKIVGQGLVNGTLFSYVFILSIASTASSGIVMRLLWKIGRTDGRPVFSYIGISVAGALVSNCAQIFAAQLMFFGSTIWVIAAPMLIVGMVTSLLLGWLANSYHSSSQWYQALLERGIGPCRYTAVWRQDTKWKADIRCVPVLAGLLLLPAVFFQRSLWFLLIDTVLVVLLAISSGRRFRILPNLLIILSMVIVHILQPSGRVLWAVGGFMVTAGALQTGLHKALVLIAMVYVSQYMTSGKPNLPGKLGKLLSVQLAYFGEFSQLWKHDSTVEKSEESDQKKTFFNRVDDLLVRVGMSAGPEVAKPDGTSTTNHWRKNVVIITSIIVFVIIYALLALQFIIVQ